MDPYLKLISLSQPLTEMSTRNLRGSKVRQARKADLTATSEPIVQKMWDPRRLTILWDSKPGTTVDLIIFNFYIIMGL
jgi:hypothetical protein